MQTILGPIPKTEDGRRMSRRAGFWLVAFGFAAIMGFSTLPTPLYVLYASRDGLSSLMVTVVFATYAVGVAASLVLAGHVSDWYGRRRVLVPATVLAAVAALVFIGWRSLPALLVGRLITGLAVGMVTATATTYLGELRGARTSASASGRAELVAVAANLGGLAAGPLISGLLAQFATDPLRTPYLVFEVLLVIVGLAFALTPETQSRTGGKPRYRPQRIAVPRGARAVFGAAAGVGFIAFATLGLFSSLAPGFVATSLHHPSHALAGVVVFMVFAAAAGGQLLLRSLLTRHILMIGAVATPIGLALLAGAMWSANLAAFVVATLITGAGAGLLFKAALTVSSRLAPEHARAEALAAFFLASYLGLAIPVIAAGALADLVSAQVDMAAFAVAATVLLMPTVTLLARSPRWAGAADAAPVQREEEVA